MAQTYLRRARDLVWFVSFMLGHVRKLLQYPPEPVSEDMGGGVIPESLSFSLLGAVECALDDHVEPLDKLLRQAAKETPGSLVQDWQKRQKGKR